MYQTLGMLWLRWGSFASSGLPDFVWEPFNTQLLLPRPLGASSWGGHNQARRGSPPRGSASSPVVIFCAPAGAEAGTAATETSRAEWSGKTSEARFFPNLAETCSRIKSSSQLWLSAVDRFRMTATESAARQGWGWYRRIRNSMGSRSR